jgi:predicted DNA-binding transcriptional regulator YafY
MMFTNDEALALSLGLVAARGLGLEDGTQAVSSARAKLERVMPEKLLARIRAVDSTVSLDGALGRPQEINSTLAALSAAAYAQQGVGLGYRRPSGEESYREFDPYGLAHRSRYWYVVGHCHARQGLRSFRLDRVSRVTPQSRNFEKPAGFDVLGFLNRAIATLPRTFSIEVLLETSLHSAQREIFQSLGVLEPCGSGVLLRSQADDLRWFSRELARLPWPFRILKPPALRDAIGKLAAAILARCGENFTTPVGEPTSDREHR